MKIKTESFHQSFKTLNIQAGFALSSFAVHAIFPFLNPVPRLSKNNSLLLNNGVTVNEKHKSPPWQLAVLPVLSVTAGIVSQNRSGQCPLQMKALGDLLIKMELSKKKRWVQNSASFYLNMQREKGFPKREDIKHGVSHLAFGSDAGDLSKLGQSHDPDQRLLPSATDKNVSSLASHRQSSTPTWPRCKGQIMNFRVKITCKSYSSAKNFQKSTTAMLIRFYFPFSSASLPLLTHKASLHPP